MSKEYIDIINNLIDLSKIVLPSLFTLLGASFGYRYGLRLIKNQGGRDAR